MYDRARVEGGKSNRKGHCGGKRMVGERWRDYRGSGDGR